MKRTHDLLRPGPGLSREGFDPLKLDQNTFPQRSSMGLYNSNPQRKQGVDSLAAASRGGEFWVVCAFQATVPEKQDRLFVAKAWAVGGRDWSNSKVNGKEGVLSEAGWGQCPTGDKCIQLWQLQSSSGWRGHQGWASRPDLLMRNADAAC